MVEYVDFTVYVGFAVYLGFAVCSVRVGFPLHEKRLRVRLRLALADPCITDFTQIAIAEDSFLNRLVFHTFLIQEQNLSRIGARTISSTLLEGWILTVLHM